jgi:REP element-mobilizing transposase RayT
MNRRDYKKFAKGEYYHIYNRGVGKMDIFNNASDYENFIKRLHLILGHKENFVRGVRPLSIKPVPKGSFTIVAYCLMPNHFHILIRQNTEISVTELISKLCTSYSMYFNKKYRRVGTLFQDTFKSINIDGNEYLLWLSAYIHQNPVVAGIAWDLSQWKWSSYSEYVEGVEGMCGKDVILEQYKNKIEYEKFVESSYSALQKKGLIKALLFD